MRVLRCKVRTIRNGNEVFGAHYDEGRITRGTDRYPVWAILAQRSIRRYRELEQLSGKVLNYKMAFP